jgi:membrane protein YqaA with SNARE-associated domain
VSRHYLPRWLTHLLVRSAAHRYYPLVVAGIALVATFTFSFPFALALIPAVLIAPRRWLALGLLSGIASGCGAALLVEAFHWLGQEFVVARYPELLQVDAWQWASDWLRRYGLIALLLIAASPMPQTPALLFCALAGVSIPGVLAAVGCGKTAKYVFLAWATVRYPGRFINIR